MNVLLVDDQRAIVESLKRDIHWKSIPVERIFTACSAKEAKMILRNFKIHVLVTDIEMPEEDGLELFQWTRENMPDVEGVFLTSHSDFAYAQKAIHMGGFDYILQPARSKDVEEVLKRVWKKVKNQEEVRRLENTKELVQEQKNNILDGLLMKVSLNKSDEADQLYRSFPDIFRKQPADCLIYPLVVKVIRWKRMDQILDERMLRLIFSNVLEELFDSAGGNVAVSSVENNKYWIIIVCDKDKAGIKFCSFRMQEFYQFIESNMEFDIAIYPAGESADLNFTKIYQSLTKRADDGNNRKGGVFWKDIPMEQHNEDAVELAKRFIQRNLNKNITRAEVAEQAHLNEEYFSRLFRQQTGMTFKEYLLMEKMNAAKQLLTDSALSVSIIASKVGFDNFSHFSKMFKKLVGKTPQEFRRNNGKG